MFDDSSFIATVGTYLRWELVEPDENVEKLPKGLAPYASPMQTAAPCLTQSCQKCFPKCCWLNCRNFPTHFCTGCQEFVKILNQKPWPKTYQTIQSTLRKRRWFLYLAHLRWLIRWFCWVPNCYNRHYWNTMVPAIENTKADFLSGGAALAFTGAGISKDSDGLMMTSFKIFVAVCKSLQDIYIYIYIWTYIYIFIYIRNV